MGIGSNIPLRSAVKEKGAVPPPLSASAETVFEGEAPLPLFVFVVHALAPPPPPTAYGWLRGDGGVSAVSAALLTGTAPKDMCETEAISGNCGVAVKGAKRWKF